MTGTPPQVTDTDSGARLSSPRKVIEHIAAKGISGCITFRDRRDPSTSWQIYTGGGQLNYATSVTGKADRLRCLIYKTHPQLSCLNFSDDQLEYASLCQFWLSEELPLSGLRQLLARLSLEALVQILAIAETTVEFSKAGKVEPMLISTSLQQLPPPLLPLVSQWQQWHIQLYSPFTRLYLDPQQQMAFQVFWQQCRSQAKVKAGPLYEADQLTNLIWVLKDRNTLYSACQLLDVQPQAFAEWIQPFLSARIVTALSYLDAKPMSEVYGTVPQSSVIDPQSRPVIACIDDSKTVQRQVRGILEMAGYHVLSITEPAQALTSLVRQKPALILMDVNMPDIDGYELCGMLRQSKQLRDIPIMMLTGRDGILDRMKAKLLGVNQYLTKPFAPDRLVECVQKLLQNAPSDP
ncbi:MAG: response regulator [Leptolyngbyaceae cyanobacterium bins.59]|nr:response regulator [Leptolyngbyaceae cyanobacterium bins.59]